MTISSDISVAHSLEWRTPVPGLRALFTGLHTTQEGTASGYNSTTSENVTADWKYDSLHRYIFSAEYVLRDLTLSAEYELDDYTMRATDSIGARPVRFEADSGILVSHGKLSFQRLVRDGQLSIMKSTQTGTTDTVNYADYGHADSYFMKWKDAALTLRFDLLPQHSGKAGRA